MADQRKKSGRAAGGRAIAEKYYSLDFDKLPAAIEARTFPHGDYVLDRKISKKKYEKQLEQLQLELVKLQKWVRETGERIIMLFEGRDAAGKGGTIKRFTYNLNPRAARIVALPKPSDVEQGQWYFQRYVTHLPTTGEMVFFDRSWYNRPGVERVMGFCKPDDVEKFFLEAPVFEGALARDGIHIFKFWLTLTREEQLKRFYERKINPLKQWKLSPIDYKAVGKWHDYTRAVMDIMAHTSTPHAPWTVIDANEQKRARLEAIRVVLDAFDYDGKDEDNIGGIDRRIVWTADEFLQRQR